MALKLENIKNTCFDYYRILRFYSNLCIHSYFLFFLLFIDYRIIIFKIKFKTIERIIHNLEIKHLR